MLTGKWYLTGKNSSLNFVKFDFKELSQSSFLGDDTKIVSLDYIPSVQGYSFEEVNSSRSGK